MIQKILAATDFNELATAAVRLAAGIASRSGGELIVLYADRFEPPAEFTAAQFASLIDSIEASRAGARDELARYVEATLEGMTVRRRTIVAEGAPAASILKVAEAEDVSLIVMGTHGRGGIKRLFAGSVAERVIAEAAVPVLTVRSGTVPETIGRVGIPAASGFDLRVPFGDAVEYATSSDDPLAYDIMAVPASNASEATIRHVRTPVLFMPHVPARGSR